MKQNSLSENRNGRNKKRNKATLKDIAKILSVDPSTVSKALRDGDDISYEMKEKVKELAKKINYRPNILARSLIKQESKILGILIPDLRINFFFEAARGMFDEAEALGYEAIIMVHDENNEKEKKKLEFMSDIHVDGILLSVTGNENLEFYKSLDAEGIKCVCWDRKIKKLDFSTIKIDDFKSSYELTSTIIKKGKKKIIYLGKIEGISVAEDRYNGYLKALEVNGIIFDKKLVVEIESSFNDANSKMEAVIDSGTDFDAVICFGGLIAYGAGSALVNRNLNIPEDVVLGEFGDNAMLYRLGIPFYTVSQNPYLMGKTAVNQLVHELKNREEDKLDIIIESEVICRNFKNSVVK